MKYSTLSCHIDLISSYDQTLQQLHLYSNDITGQQAVEHLKIALQKNLVSQLQNHSLFQFHYVEQTQTLGTISLSCHEVGADSMNHLNKLIKKNKVSRISIFYS